MADSKVVVITGASEGIGAALAEQLGARGDRVVLAARREKELNEVKARAGSNALAVPTDVTKRVEVERLRDRAIDAFGQIDVWVNNVGRGISRNVVDLTDADVDGIITINLKSRCTGCRLPCRISLPAATAISSTSRHF